jgi:hypothetical protein
VIVTRIELGTKVVLIDREMVTRMRILSEIQYIEERTRKGRIICNQLLCDLIGIGFTRHPINRNYDLVLKAKLEQLSSRSISEKLGDLLINGTKEVHGIDL